MADDPELQKVEYNTNPPDLSIRLKEKEMDSGFLGKLFGSPTNAPTNIAGFVSAVSILALVIICILAGQAQGIESAKLIAPIITLVLGYLFGKKQ